MSSNNTNNANVITLKPSEVAEAVEHMIHVNLTAVKNGESRRGLFIWGPPGVGKSAIVGQVAKKLGMGVVDIRLAQMDSTDLRGVPVPVTVDGKTTVVWAIPRMLPDNPDDQIVVFLDELPNADQATQTACYQLVLDGKLGEYVLPPNCVVIAAGNREVDRSGTFKMSMALSNRFDHIEITHDFNDWIKYATLNGYVKEIIGYITSFKDELMMFNPKSASRAFATPRAWEMVHAICREADRKAKIGKHISDNVFRALIAGAVGDAVAARFCQYRKDAMQLPDPALILNGKLKTLPDNIKKTVNLQYAMVTSLLYELRGEYNKSVKRDITVEEFEKQFDNLLGYMLDNMQVEMLVMAMRTVMSVFELEFNTDNLKNWERFAEEHGDMVLEA